ncbi:phosphopantothenoylcysteine decarboxylase, partial [Nanoarchaeota archaeon]
IIVGFALETDNLEENMKKKFKEKNLDIIVGNSPKTINSDKITPIIITKNKTKKLKEMAKESFANVLIDEVKGLF